MLDVTPQGIQATRPEGRSVKTVSLVLTHHSQESVGDKAGQVGGLCPNSRVGLLRWHFC